MQELNEKITREIMVKVKFPLDVNGKPTLHTTGTGSIVDFGSLLEGLHDRIITITITSVR